MRAATARFETYAAYAVPRERWTHAARLARNLVLFAAAPFIGLVYALAFPFVGLAALGWMAVRAVRDRAAA